LHRQRDRNDVLAVAGKRCLGPRHAVSAGQQHRHAQELRRTNGVAAKHLCRQGRQPRRRRRATRPVRVRQRGKPEGALGSLRHPVLAREVRPRCTGAPELVRLVRQRERRGEGGQPCDDELRRHRQHQEQDRHWDVLLQRLGWHEREAARGGNGLSFERETKGGVITYKHYINAGGVVVGVLSTPSTNVTSNTTGSMSYFHYDHLGSVAAISDAAANVVERRSFDPWGKARQGYG